MSLDGDVDWSDLPEPRPGLRCTVVLPARNEEALLPRALHAIASQRGVTFSYEVIVLANNCSDDTAARARRFANSCAQCAVHVVEFAWPEEIANVGRARRALMEKAAQRVTENGAANGLIVTTDADTCVAEDWLAATAAAIDAGADAVGGRIEPVADAALPNAAWHLMRLDDLYRTWRERLQCLIDPDPADPWPRHHQHFGASLAVTARAYRAVGGLPLVPFLEDEALVRALRLEDLSVRHCPAVRVRTSARLDGRVEVGLSWQLREWSNHQGDGITPLVANPVVEAGRWALRRQLRGVWRVANSQRQRPGYLVDGICQVADAMQIDHKRLAEQVCAARSFGQLWESLDADCNGTCAADADPLVPMDHALHTLRRLVQAQRIRSVG